METISVKSLIEGQTAAPWSWTEALFSSQPCLRRETCPSFYKWLSVESTTHCFRCWMSSGHIFYLKSSTRSWIVQRTLHDLYSKPQGNPPSVPSCGKLRLKRSHLCSVPCGFIMDISAQLWSGPSQCLGGDESDSEWTPSFCTIGPVQSLIWDTWEAS